MGENGVPWDLIVIEFMEFEGGGIEEAHCSDANRVRDGRDLVRCSFDVSAAHFTGVQKWVPAYSDDLS